MKTSVISKVRENIAKVIVGQDQVTKLIMTAILANGNILIEDMPGTGKTVLSSSLAKSIGGTFSRIQFTPDLLPSDVTGINYYNQNEGEFVFKEGPAFCNILLADEINRATPRTQSSLLECMAEKQITVDGVTRKLEKPFFVIATQNPIETLGTYPLPEAQLDRFMMRINMDSPSKSTEMAILNRFLKDQPLETLSSVCTAKEIAEISDKIKDEIYIHPLLIEYIADIAVASRQQKNVQAGISPRASLAMLSAARAYAFISGRNYVVPEDIKELAPHVFAHRIKLGGAISPVSEQKKVIDTLLSSVPLTTEEWSK
ncbi:MAG: MoxR family ATPase [Clostridia bacterium]